MGVALFLVQQKVSLASPSVARLVGLLQQSAEGLSKSSKFAKLVMELCKSQQYKELVRHKEKREL